MSNETHVLSVKNITKTFGNVHAVKDVSFNVDKGEILGLIGPNGSGKSTLFNCILGQLTPNRGNVLVNGKSVSGMASHKLNKIGIGRTFQQLSVFPQMTVLDNIILSGQEHHGTMFTRLLGKPDAGLTEEADQLIQFFKLDHLRDELADSLSYGQQKLLDVAMAFMAGPNLVLLDEPAGGVNLTMLNNLKERLKTFNKDHNSTFVVIEHNMEFVMSLCTRIIVLAAGEIIAEGTPDEIRNNPEVIEAYLGG